MEELVIKKVKIESEVVRVIVKFRPRKGLDKRRRFYTSDALELIKETHPRLELGMFLKVCTARNYDDDKLAGEWIFELKKKKIAKKKSARKQAKLEAVEELVRVTEEAGGYERELNELKEGDND